MDAAINAPAAEEYLFLGTFERPVDDKRRVQIPSEWRPTEDMRFALIVWPQDPAGTCLRLLPVSELRELMRVIESWATDDEDRRVLKQHVGGNSAFVTPDKAGRVCIPEIMANEAGLSVKAKLVGSVDKFEIWEPGRHEEIVKLRRPRLARALARVE
jgi:MraZ protein